MPTQFNTLMINQASSIGGQQQPTDRGTSLADEYRQKQREMDERLKKEIESHKIASVYAGGAKEPLQSMKVNENGVSEGIIPTYEAKPSKFVRSTRSIALRIKEDYENHQVTIEQEKMALIQRLNEAILELDKLNQEKGELNDRLIRLFQFTRDMERHTLRCDDGDLLQVVDESLKEELRFEKREGVSMQERIRGFEEERYRIREKISEVEHRKEEIGNQRAEMQQILEQRSRQVQDIEIEYNETKERINAFQAQVDDLRALCCQLQEMVNGHRHDLHYTNGGKVCLVDQFQQLERKFGFIQETSQRELNEIQYRHKRRSKLLATFLLTKRVVDIANRNSYNSALSILRRHAQVKHSSIQGLLRMRRILKHNRRNRLRRALYKWYFQELQPLKNFRQSRQAPKVLLKRHRGFRAFYAWRVALYRKVEQIHLKLSRLQSLVTLKTHKDHVAMKEFIVRWRQAANQTFGHKMQALRKILVERDTQIMRNRLYRWKALVLDLESQIQMRAMMKRFTLKSFVTSVFQNWRFVIADIKAKRMTLMSKSWKSFKIHVMQQKQMRAAKILSIRELRMRWKKYILQVCFNAFRINKQEEKLNKVTKSLIEDEIPRKNRCIEDMLQIRTERLKQIQREGFKNIQNQTTRQFFQYFKHWREVTDQGIITKNEDIKQRLIYRYKWILAQAFTRWVDFRNKSMIDQQNQTNGSWEQANKGLQFEIKGQNEIIDNLKDRQKVEAAKHMKKLIMSAFERHLRVKYVKWRDSVNYLIDRERRIERILLKLHDRRLKKLGFNTFLDKFEICVEDSRQDKIGDKGRQTISDNLKKSCFKKIHQNAINSLHCKDLMARILLKLDLNHKDEIFKKWLKYMNFQRELALESSQNQIVSTIAICQQEIGKLSDSVEEQNQQNQQLRDRYKQNCQKLVSLYFKRCHHMATQYFFERWRNKVIEYQRGQKIIINAALHATTACLRFSFQQWYLNGSVVVKQRALIQNLNYEDRLIQAVKTEIDHNQHQHELNTDYLQTKIQKENAQSQILEVKHSRTLQAIVGRVNENHHCLKMRYILNQWHLYVQTRKRCVKALTLAIRKTHWQQAFTAIRERARAVQRQRLIEQSTNLFALKFTKIKYRGFFKQWMSQGHLKVLQLSQRDFDDRTARVKDQGKLIKLVNTRVRDQLLQHRQYVLKSECFWAWREEIRLLKAFKVKTAMLQRRQIELQQVDAVKLWRARVKETKKYRRGLARTNNLVCSHLLQDTFYAWAHFNRINKDFARSLSNLANKVDKVYVLRAFESIKEHSETSNTVTLFSKFKACQYLFSTIASAFDSQSLRSSFYLIRHSGVRMTRNEKAIKSITKYWVGHKLRGYIRQWKEETDRLETIRFNLQEGKTSVEVHNLRRTLNALKQMCLLEGICPKKIQKLIVRADERSNETVMRVISRLLCHGDEQLRIIPTCFDRWRQWVRFRKMYSYWLKFANSFANPKLHALARAFRLWKALNNDLKSQLRPMKVEVLSKLCVYNDGKLDNLAQSFDLANAEIEDLTSQRGILLQRYVSSQKLALSSVQKQNERAQQKVVSRWLSQCKRTEKVKLDQVLKQNLMRIASLKDRIKHLESSNQEIAIQNEDFRQGALDGIEMARNLDDLQREKEVLAIDLADKALVIRRLLEDNSNLNAQLASAQQHAHRLIQITQARLNNNNIHPQ